MRLQIAERNLSKKKRSREKKAISERAGKHIWREAKPKSSNNQAHDPIEP
jgi:hypothetical protein